MTPFDEGKAWYNENDPFAADWLERLIQAGLIAPGIVDRRSIVDVRGADLAGFIQCHFFAGIGGWSAAFRLAGWPDNKPGWTGSCPCQPLSSAGRHKGHADERHLWPAFHSLIAQCRPTAVLGEQVGNADGREWLAGVRADLEALGYACGAADLCAAGVKAPHLRQRLYWCADARGAEWGTASKGRSDVNHRPNSGRQEAPGRPGFFRAAGVSASDADARGAQRSGAQRNVWPMENGPWEDVEWVGGGDEGKFRIKPGLSLLAHGLPDRVGRLRGYGNAIVPQVAAQFVGAFLECQP